jgi:hypothetical protein
MLYSHNNQEPQELPDRIRLTNGYTRTDRSTFTEQELADAGYRAVLPKPQAILGETVYWDTEAGNWNIRPASEEEIAVQWSTIKNQRLQMIGDCQWRYDRYNRETRLGLTPTESLTDLDQYVQALADITEQEDPFNIQWPQAPWTSAVVDSKE